jgi:hypothetical protein
MKRFVSLSFVLVVSILLLTGCGDSTSITSLGEYKEVPNDLRENLLKYAKKFDRKDYYGTWYRYEKHGADSLEVTIKIDKKYFEDVESGKKVKYKFNKKTNELVLDTKTVADFFDKGISKGNIVYTFLDGEDTNILHEMGHATDENGKNIPFLGEYQRISTEEDLPTSEIQDTEEVVSSNSAEDSTKESSDKKPITLTQSDIFEIENNKETYQFISLTSPASDAVEAALKNNGFSYEDIYNKIYSTFVDQDRNVVTVRLYSHQKLLEKIMMIDIDSHKVLDVNIPASSAPPSSTESTKAFDHNKAESNPMLGDWITIDNTKYFHIKKDYASLKVGSADYELIKPKISGNKVEYNSNFNIGSSAMIHKVELEWVQDDKAKARFYLDDDRVITEDLSKN